MKTYALVLFAAASIAAASWGARSNLGVQAGATASRLPAVAPRTLRVDYFHTGNATEERFSLDRIVIEPLRGPGARRGCWTIRTAASTSSRSSTHYVLTFENRSFRDVASFAPYEFVEILVNAQTYGGGGIFGQHSTVAADSEWAPYVFVHEFGHHFAGLADEYYTSDVAYLPAADRVEPCEPNVTALLDPAKLKWADLVVGETPIPTPWPKDAFEALSRDTQARRRQIRAANRPEAEMDALFRTQQAEETRLLGGSPHAGRVGAFEGAMYEARGYFRPQVDCIMFTRDEVPFCAVCQRAISRVIDRYSH